MSPVHDQVARHQPRWTTIAEMHAAADFGDPAADAETARKLGMCDASAFTRVLLKGLGAKAALEAHGVTAPAAVYDAGEVEGDGIILRTGGAEYIIEDGPRGALSAAITASHSPKADLVVHARQDASFLLSGGDAIEVLLQTCGYDFARRECKFVYTRVAGVSCGVFPRTINGINLFQLWLDPSYAPYLWETLEEIVQEAGGRHVGLSVFFASIKPE